jgi:cytosine/creatinine deaminase
LSIDFHLDFDLDASWMHLDEVVRQTEAMHDQGRVTVGHVTKLSALPARRQVEIRSGRREQVWRSRCCRH